MNIFVESILFWWSLNLTHGLLRKKYQAIFGKARIQKSFVKAVAIYTIFSLILLYITGKTHSNIIAHKYNWKQ